jgi:zinc and cadmium transporter
LLGLYCALAFVASLAGGWFPLMVRLTHTRLQAAVSFVAGLMLGMALLHLIPHAAFQVGSVDRVVGWALVGFLGMFFLQRFFYHHHHDVPNEDPEDCCGGTGHDHAALAAVQTAPHAHTLAAKSARQLSWMGTTLGLTLHSLMDGFALAAAVASESLGHGGGWVGLGTALVVILHKPFDSLAISTLMTGTGCSRRGRHWLNAAYALVCPLGVVVFYQGTSHLAPGSSLFLGCALALCAGTFLCIACSDLLPELQFHSHDRFILSLSLLAGLAVAVVVGKLETSGHDHHRESPAAATDHDHDHAPESPPSPASPSR